MILGDNYETWEEAEGKPTPDTCVRVPLCPLCGKPMIPSFAIMGKEFVCVPCGHAEEYFNHLRKVFLHKVRINDLRRRYDKDLNHLAFTQGGAVCMDCGNTGGNNCRTCAISKTLEYWGKQQGKEEGNQ